MLAAPYIWSQRGTRCCEGLDYYNGSPCCLSALTNIHTVTQQTALTIACKKMSSLPVPATGVRDGANQGVDSSVCLMTGLWVRRLFIFHCVRVGWTENDVSYLLYGIVDHWCDIAEPHTCERIERGILLWHAGPTCSAGEQCWHLISSAGANSRKQA
jgi:hypothetical protein